VVPPVPVPVPVLVLVLVLVWLTVIDDVLDDVAAPVVIELPPLAVLLFVDVLLAEAVPPAPPVPEPVELPSLVPMPPSPLAIASWLVLFDCVLELDCELWPLTAAADCSTATSIDADCEFVDSAMLVSPVELFESVLVCDWLKPPVKLFVAVAAPEVMLLPPVALFVPEPVLVAVPLPPAPPVPLLPEPSPPTAVPLPVCEVPLL